ASPPLRFSAGWRIPGRGGPGCNIRSAEPPPALAPGRSAMPIPWAIQALLSRNPRMAARILVVDDEPDISALVAYQLAREGYRVRTAASGTEALEALERELPDLMVLDLMLPGMSGLDVLAEVRRNEEWQGLPVILLTALREEPDRVEG